MFKFIHKSAISLSVVLLVLACKSVSPESGVSAELASERSGFISNIRYSLYFDLTKTRDEVQSLDTIRFDALAKKDVVLDFKVPGNNLISVQANGCEVDVSIANEHILIPRKYVRKGGNCITVKFTAGEQSLNRRDEFLFTLLVPDRARTLFPCFDQPDLKAVYELALKLPAGWFAVSNSHVISLNENDDSAVCRFAPTNPLSTYLFSFVAGRFERIECSRSGRYISMYHRETDADKIAQSDEIFKLVFDSLDWLEEYTGIPYPFDKYDFIVLPDFQYGGMEHAGATLYNDRRIFLGKNPTTDELLERASLIAHETAHMWFGDYVTMRWFDDVWTKEVFANWFAAQIMRPLFPSINHTLSDLTYYASAYSEDRTRGTNAIQRPLANLQDAGLIYCNIIYDKAPVVMDKLAVMLGQENFRKGMREYLHLFGYSNATWDDLVRILDKYTDTDLVSWSRIWIKEAGMPEYVGKIENGNTVVSQIDPLGRGLEWQQELSHKVAEGRFWIPNTDGKGYGWFRPDAASMDYIMAHWREYDEVERMSLLMTLYENSWHGTLERKRFIEWCCAELPMEKNPLIQSSIISFSASESLRCDSDFHLFSDNLSAIAANPSYGHELRLLSFRQLFKLPCSSLQWDELYSIWKSQSPCRGLVLGEADYTDLACQLMIAFPERASEIAAIQSDRIDNPDRKQTFAVLCKAASPDTAVRKALFDSFLASPENRRPESRVLSALSLLCHHSRLRESLSYIVPSLDVLPEIQRTGDIFFPASWCRTLLKNQQSPEAKNIVDDWIASHPDTNPLLVTKILQAE